MLPLVKPPGFEVDYSLSQDIAELLCLDSLRRLEAIAIPMLGIRLTRQAANNRVWCSSGPWLSV